ncbi:MAG: MarR family transcriptional regulator [Rhizobiaceae bacterium]|nr:MarR family transcriptional regulator [Rhizobiaceae bacterium]
MSTAENILKLAGVEQEPTPYQLQDQVGFVLRKAQQRHVAIFASRIPDLTPPQFAALAMLYEMGDTSQNQLGQMVAMDAATVKGVIDRLKARGFVSVDKDESDKRRLTIRLTAEGKQAVRELTPLAREITAETLSPLTSREAETLLRLLNRIA